MNNKLQMVSFQNSERRYKMYIILLSYIFIQFEERVERLIKEIESKNLGSHDDDLNKQEKQKFEEEK